MTDISIDASVQEMVDRLMDLDLDEISDAEFDKKLRLAKTICELGELSIKSREQANTAVENELTRKKLMLDGLKLADLMGVAIPENAILELTHDRGKPTIS